MRKKTKAKPTKKMQKPVRMPWRPDREHKRGRGRK